MPRASNGRIPTDWLVTLDTGRGRHVTLPTPAVRWYLLRRNVKARTGVTLYITDGMNAYRDWDEQGVGRRNACNSGNCNAAAAQGYSSHGGTWTYSGRLIDAMAFDIGNYWAIPWDVFREECERVGLHVGLITRAIAGIEEPWHVIDLDPYGAPPMGLTLTRGADGVYRLDDEEMANSDRILQVVESIENALIGDGKTAPQKGGAVDILKNIENALLGDGKRFPAQEGGLVWRVRQIFGRVNFAIRPPKADGTPGDPYLIASQGDIDTILATGAGRSDVEAAVREAVKESMATAGVDPAVIESAAERGARAALQTLTLRAES